MHGWFWFKTVLHKVYVILAHVDLWLRLHARLLLAALQSTPLVVMDLQYEKQLHVIKMPQCEDQIYDLLGQKRGKLSRVFLNATNRRGVCVCVLESGSRGVNFCNSKLAEPSLANGVLTHH